MSPKLSKSPPQRTVQTGFTIWCQEADDEGTMPSLPMGELGVLITGVARGGTSWAASVCHHLGVNLGRRGPRYENQRLSRPLLNGKLGLLKSRLAGDWDPNQAWAWKLPALNQHLDEISNMVEKARFIFVIRDPIAVALRKQKSNETSGDPVRDTRLALSAFTNLCEFAGRIRRPCLFLSYEKGLSSPKGSIEDIARFIGRPVSPASISSIIDAVNEDQNAYVGASAVALAASSDD